MVDLIKGGIDLHTHSNPSWVHRSVSDFELAKEAKDYGLGGIVIKAHECPTAGRAYLVQKIYPDIHVFGGIALNLQLGGLNPFALEVAIKMGAQIVWLPTSSAANHIRRFEAPGKQAKRHFDLDPGEGISVLDNSGNLKPEVLKIIEMVAKADIVLASGHHIGKWTFRIGRN